MILFRIGIFKIRPFQIRPFTIATLLSEAVAYSISDFNPVLKLLGNIKNLDI